MRVLGVGFYIPNEFETVILAGTATRLEVSAPSEPYEDAVGPARYG
jgi:hypothetical protein